MRLLIIVFHCYLTGLRVAYERLRWSSSIGHVKLAIILTINTKIFKVNVTESAKINAGTNTIRKDTYSFFVDCLGILTITVVLIKHIERAHSRK